MNSPFSWYQLHDTNLICCLKLLIVEKVVEFNTNLKIKLLETNAFRQTELKKLYCLKTVLNWICLNFCCSATWNTSSDQRRYVAVWLWDTSKDSDHLQPSCRPHECPLLDRSMQILPWTFPRRQLLWSGTQNIRRLYSLWNWLASVILVLFNF